MIWRLLLLKVRFVPPHSANHTCAPPPKQESPPARTQEAYRLPRSKCSLCCSVSWWGVGVGYPIQSWTGGTPCSLGLGAGAGGTPYLNLERGYPLHPLPGLGKEVTPPAWTWEGGNPPLPGPGKGVPPIPPSWTWEGSTTAPCLDLGRGTPTPPPPGPGKGVPTYPHLPGPGKGYPCPLPGPGKDVPPCLDLGRGTPHPLPPGPGKGVPPPPA